MKRSEMLTIASLLSIVLLMCHLADDFVRGISPVGPWALLTLPLFGGWMYATLVVGERRTGYFVNLLGGLIALLMPVLHMKRVWPATGIAKPGSFFFLFTLMALGALGIFSMIFSVRGLLNPQWGQTK
jgi:hypothetical protein